MMNRASCCVRRALCMAVLVAGCGSAWADWTYDAAAGTITDENGIVLKVASATDGLKVTGVTTLNGQTKIDFSKPVADAEGTPFAIAEVGGFGGSSKAAALQTVKEVVLPAGLKRISAAAFMYCGGLEKVTPFLPDTVETIGASAFNRCPNLAGELRLSNPKLTAIAGAMFFNDASGKITKVDMRGSGLTEIPQGTFYSNTSLGEVYLPDGLQQITGNAFSRCSTLTNVVPFLPKTLTALTGEAFAQCAKLALPVDLRCPNLKTIGNSAFSQTAVPSIDMTGAPVEYIGSEAFSRNSALTNITPLLPKTVTFVGDSALNRCPNLEGELVISNHKVVNKLMFLTYSDNTTKITSINLWKSGVTCIQWNAFYCNKGLNSFYLPRDFEGFDPVNTAQNTFGGCSNLKNFYFPGGPFKYSTGTVALKGIGALQMRVFVPRNGRGAAAWQAYLADPEKCTIVDLTDAEKAAYRTKFPDDDIPCRQKIILRDESTVYEYLCFWNPAPGLSVLLR